MALALYVKSATGEKRYRTIWFLKSIDVSLHVESTPYSNPTTVSLHNVQVLPDLKADSLSLTERKRYGGIEPHKNDLQSISRTTYSHIPFSPIMNYDTFSNFRSSSVNHTFKFHTYFLYRALSWFVTASVFLRRVP